MPTRKDIDKKKRNLWKANKKNEILIKRKSLKGMVSGECFSTSCSYIKC